MIARLASAPILLALMAILMGTGIDAMIKGIAPNAGLHHLLAWRFLFGALIALVIFRAQKRPRPGGAAIRFHTMRGLIQVATAFLFFYALTQLKLAEATTIGFTAALMVPGVAWLLLGERITPVAMFATLFGFAGAALAVSGAAPTEIVSNNRTLGLIAAFTSALLYALVLVMLRMRATHEDATTIAMFTNVVPALALLPISLGFPLADMVWQGAAETSLSPHWPDLAYFAMFGVLGYSVWYLMTLAYAQAPAQRLAPLEYTSLIWSALLGVVFFAEVPGWRLWAGAGLIIIACLIVAFEDRFRTRTKAGLPASDLPE